MRVKVIIPGLAAGNRFYNEGETIGDEVDDVQKRRFVELGHAQIDFAPKEIERAVTGPAAAMAITLPKEKTIKVANAPAPGPMRVMTEEHHEPTGDRPTQMEADLRVSTHRLIDPQAIARQHEANEKAQKAKDAAEKSKADKAKDLKDKAEKANTQAQKPAPAPANTQQVVEVPEPVVTKAPDAPVHLPEGEKSEPTVLDGLKGNI